MRALRWMFAVSMTAVGFTATAVVASWAGLDAEPAVGVAAVVATLILTPLGWWASRPELELPPVPPVDPAPALVTPPGDPRRTRPQIVVGDLPGEAVAWQERIEVMERLRVVGGTGQTAVVCAVTGQRGTGKTQLAAAYARACVAQGWPVVVWVAAETVGGVLAGLDVVAAAAGVRPADADPADGAAAALAWLRVHPGPCLVVYDNAVDTDLIRRWTASVGGVQTIVTTTDAAFDGLGVRIDVDLFTESEAVTYLRQRTGLADDDGAAQLAEQLGWLPLALSQAGAVIGRQRRYTSYRAYLQQLERLPIGDLLPRVGGDPYPRGTAEAILISLGDLAADPGAAARRLLDHLAVLAPSGVDPTLLQHLAAQLDSDGGGDDAHAFRALLAQRSLTTPTLDQDRTVVHRLIQRVAREGCRQAGGLDAVLTAAADAVQAAAEHAGQRWDDRTLLVEYADHAQTLWTHQVGNAARPRLLSLRGRLLYLLNVAHIFTTAIAVGQPLIADCERVLGPDDPETLISRHNLAAAYQSVGRLNEAIGLYQRTLADCERVLGPDHPDTLTSRHSLAAAYQSVGRSDEAIGLHQRTLTDRERVLGPDHPETLTSRNNLAGAYQGVGRSDEAIGLYQRTLTDRERVLGPDHPGTLTSRHNLAHAYQSVGRLDEAIGLYQRTLTDRERVLGPDHPGTLTSRHNLAAAYQGVGRLDEAIGLFERTLTDRKRVLGPDHPNTLISRNNLAGAYQSVGRSDEAIGLYQRTLADCERVLGPDHPDTLTSRNNLADAYQSVGRSDEAIGLHQRTLTDRERVLGPDHPETLSSRNNLAYAYERVGRSDEAIGLYQRTLADCERVLGPDHPDTLIARNNLAAAYERVGRLDGAIGLYQRTLADRERVLGPDHPDTLISRSNLAGAYQSVGRSDEAIGLYQRTLADRERVLGPDHPETLTSRNNLAAAYQRVGRLDEAIGLHQRTLADFERVLGSDHPNTLISRNNLAYAYRAVGRRRSWLFKLWRALGLSRDSK
ncbi:FxSxx-COOH system tetratricopeptide repeat protein [Micromonospora sp. IBSANI012]|uniref:FxSxx-COOH system tetratricopeptide repeat protein n=1 Tax=Micromonospora sp. IBSANI012 TaxID=3457761 RepID=UPI004058D540